jgi:hypothetical protein
MNVSCVVNPTLNTILQQNLGSTRLLGMVVGGPLPG